MITTHVVSEHSAAGALSQMLTEKGEEHSIITMLDDLRLGKLCDVNTSTHTRRIEMWKAIWKSGWYYGAEYEDVECQFLHHFNASQEAIKLLNTHNNPTVVWLGHNANDHLMLAMCASMLPTSTSLSIVHVGKTLSALTPYEYNSVGMCPQHLLHSLSSAPLSTAERAALRHDWFEWQATGTGWRELNRDGEVVEYPLTHLDMKLAASLASLGPSLVTLLIGDVMLNTAEPIPSSVLYWRLQCMAEEGGIHYMKDKLGNGSPTVIATHTQ